VRLGIKKLIGQFPVAGPIFDVLLEYRSKVKQKRLNHFVSLLEDAFIRHGILAEQLQTEESTDLLEQVIKKVTETRSDKKRIGFKNLLVKEITEPASYDDCEVFNELLAGLKERELEILVEHQLHLVNDEPLLYRFHRLEDELKLFRSRQFGIHTTFYNPPHHPEIERALAETLSLLKAYERKCTPALFGLDHYQYQFFLRDLIAKGLLVDQGIGSRYDPTPLKFMGITSFGVKFLKFLGE
jgi:hypothetical protein